MMHAGVDDGLTGLGQVARVVLEVEVAIPSGAMLGHQLGLQSERLEILRLQRHARDRARQDLQVDVFADGVAHLVHAREGILTHIEEGRLVASAPTELEVTHPSLFGCRHGRQDVVEPHLAPE